MLTNQMIGAAHNVGVHTPRSSVPEPPTVAIPSQTADRPATDQISARAVTPNTKADGADTTFADRPPLQTPKRAEMQVAVVDSMPDVVPESIYKAKVAEADA